MMDHQDPCQPTDAPNVLASYLDRVAQGERLGSIVASVPEPCSDVIPLIVVAAMSRTNRPLPDAAFRQRLGAALLEADGDSGANGVRPTSLVRQRVALRLVAAAAAVTLAFGMLSTAAGAAPGDVYGTVRRVLLDAGLVFEHWVAQPKEVVQPVSAVPIRRETGGQRSAGPNKVQAQQPSQRGTRADATPTPPPTVSQTPAGMAPTERPARVATPAVARPIQAAAASSPTTNVMVEGAESPRLQPAPAPVEPTAMPATVLSVEAATAVAAGLAPVIAPAPPAVIGGAGISGMVTFIDETVFPGVTVTAYPLDPRGAVIWPWGVSVRSDLDGSYQILRIRAGRYKVAVGERGPWVYRRWYEDTRHEHAAEPIDVRTGRITEGIDVRTRVWPLGDLLFTDPAAALRWLRWY